MDYFKNLAILAMVFIAVEVSFVILYSYDSMIYLIIRSLVIAALIAYIADWITKSDDM